MVEEFEYLGIWWFPENPRKRFPGTLTFKPNGHPVLKLINDEEYFTINLEVVNFLEKELSEVKLGFIKNLIDKSFTEEDFVQVLNEANIKFIQDEIEKIIRQIRQVEEQKYEASLKNSKIILGVTYDGKNITLQDCSLHPIPGHARNLSIRLLYASIVYIGVHFKKEEDIKFKELFIYYLHLTEWVHISGFKRAPYMPEREHANFAWRNLKAKDIKGQIYGTFFGQLVYITGQKSSIINLLTIIEDLFGLRLSIFWEYMPHKLEDKIEYNEPDPVKIAEFDDYIISINFLYSGCHYNPFKQEVDMSQKAYIEIKSSQEQSLGRFLNISRYIQDFLTLGISKPVYPIKIKGLTAANRVFLPDNESFCSPVDIIFVPTIKIPTISEEIQHPCEMLFTFRDLEDKISLFLKNWIFDSNQLKTIYGLYFASIYSSEMYIEYKFLSRIQALEGYYRLVLMDKDMSERYFLINEVLNIQSYVIENNLKKSWDKQNIKSSFWGQFFYLEGQRNLIINFFNIIDNAFSLHRLTFLEFTKHEYKVNIILNSVPDDYKETLEKQLKYSNEPSLAIKLKQIIKENTECVQDFLCNRREKDKFIKKVTTIRNYLTHPKNDLEGRKYTNKENLIILSHFLKILLEIVFLKEIGFDSDETKKIILKQYERFKKQWKNS